MNASPTFPAATAATEASGRAAPPGSIGIALSAAPFPPGLTLHAFRSARRGTPGGPAAAGEAAQAPVAHAWFAAAIALISILLVVFTLR